MSALTLSAMTLDAMTLDEAYAALRTKNYQEAIRGFEQAATAEPGRASIRKDLAYTLLKIGEAEAARDQFAEAMTPGSRGRSGRAGIRVLMLRDEAAGGRAARVRPAAEVGKRDRDPGL